MTKAKTVCYYRAMRKQQAKEKTMAEKRSRKPSENQLNNYVKKHFGDYVAFLRQCGYTKLPTNIVSYWATATSFWYKEHGMFWLEW